MTQFDETFNFYHRRTGKHPDGQLIAIFRADKASERLLKSEGFAQYTPDALKNIGYSTAAMDDCKARSRHAYEKMGKNLADLLQYEGLNRRYENSAGTYRHGTNTRNKNNGGGY